MLGRRHRKQAAVRRPGIPKVRAGRVLTAVLIFLGLLAIVLPLAVFAQSAGDQLASGLEATQPALGLATTDVRLMIARIIRYFFALVGLLAVCLFIYGGYIYMMAKGDATEVDRAKKVMINAIIGLLIIMMAYAIAEFVIRAILGGTGPGGGQSGSGTGGTAVTSGYCSGCGPEQLGNGIISYHYPEPNQRDVPRNVSIAITFKKPILPSTVLSNYFDNGTYDKSDDLVCTPDCKSAGSTKGPIDWNTTIFKLNSDNIKIMPAAKLGGISGGTMDDRFDGRYPSAEILTGTPSALTQVDAAFDPNNTGQTLVITPPLSSPLGSSQEDMEYRVGLRGGDNGIKAWSWDPSQGKEVIENAFSQFNPDGSYFWNFTTGTLLDLTPPRITGVVPVTVQDYSAAGRELYRNQLLQVYFSKAMNPITVSGQNGSIFADAKYQGASGWVSLTGKWAVASGYKAIEFTPDTTCDGIAENSCGDKVYCLPPNVPIAVILRPANVSDQPPRAVLPINGVVDMVSNSLDGDADGQVEGQGAFDPVTFLQNVGQIGGTSVKANFSLDTVGWFYRVGNGVDLVPPEIVSVDPPNDTSRDYTAGSSRFPVDQPITADWTKVMSISSVVTGPDSYAPATVTLRARETPKSGTPPGTPWFTIEPLLINADQQSRLVMKHRVFFTSNDLGWLPEDGNAAKIPVYVPVFKSRLKDVRQNCFYPSEIADCGTDPVNKPYCCNKTASGTLSGACRNQ